MLQAGLRRTALARGAPLYHFVAWGATLPPMRCPSCGRKVPSGGGRCYACQTQAPTAIEERADATADDVQTLLVRPTDATVDDVSTLHRGGGSGPVPLVGRDNERDRVAALWRKVGRGQTLRVLLVRGPEGIGKTRFIEHCIGRIERGSNPPMAVLRARPPEVDGQRGSAFAAMVRRQLAVPVGASTEEGRRRLLAAVRERLPGTAAFDVASLLGRLLDLPSPGAGALHLVGDALERRMARALSALLRSDGPTLLWIDAVDRLGPADQRLLRRVVGALQKQPVLVVATGRDTAGAAPPGTDVMGIDLAPLDDAAVGQMVRALLAKCPDVPPDLIAAVNVRAQGNPRAIEGAVHVLMGRGVVRTERPVWSVDLALLADRELPADPAALLGALIRGLPREDRRVLDAGAIQGREFVLAGVLACLCADERAADDFWVQDPRRRRAEAALERLQANELVEVSGPDRWRLVDERTADLVLAGVEEERLARWRRVIAQWLEGRGDADGREAAAEFWEAGGRPARAAAGHKAAGDRAAERFAADEAVDRYTRALELLDDADFRQRLELRRALGDVRDGIGDHKGAVKEFEAMLRDCAAAQTAGDAALALRRIGEVRGGAGDWDRARLSLGRARALYEAVGDVIGVATTLEALGQVELYRGSPRSMAEAQANVELALRLRRETGDDVGVAHSYHYLGWIHGDAGRDAEAQAAYEAAIRIRRGSGDRGGLVRSLNNLGDIHVAFGRHEAGRQRLAESLEECEAIGLASVRPTILVNLARSHLDTGDLADAADWTERADKALEGVDDRLTVVDLHLLKSRLLQALGEQAQAVEQGEAAGRLVEAMEGSYQQGVVLRRLAELHSATLYDPSGGQGSAGKAEELFGRSVAVLEAAGHDLELAQTLDAYGRFLTERGRRDEASALSRRASALRT